MKIPCAATKTQRRLEEEKNNVWHDRPCRWPNPTRKPDHLPVFHHECWGASSNGCLASGCEAEWKVLSRGLCSPWNSPGQNTGVGNLSLLQAILPTQGSNPGLLHCGRILYQLTHQGSPLGCVSRTIFSSVVASHSSFLGEVSPQLPEIIIIVHVLPFTLLKDSGVSFSFSSVSPPPKTVDWRTRFTSPLFMIRKAWRSGFQNASHAVNTVGRDMLLKGLHFSP